jgi:hypothetical protein
MSSLVWSSDLKFAFKSSRNSIELESLKKTLKSDEFKSLTEMKKQNKIMATGMSTLGFWN